MNKKHSPSPFRGSLSFLSLFLLGLAVLILTSTCEKSPHDKTRSRLLQDTTGKADPFAKVRADGKPARKQNTESVVLRAALKTRNFDPESWLASDRDFYARPNPLQLSPYDRIIKKMSRRYGFDWRLIAAQIYAESNFKNEARSHVGATGLMQLMPSTAEFLGTKPEELLLPEVNIALGCRYNQRLYHLWGRQTQNPDRRLVFALASYNAGRRTVLREYDPAQGMTTWVDVHPELPKETQMYVHKIYLKYDLYKRHLLP